MSVLAKQLQRNPGHGYARDLVSLVREIAPTLKNKNIKLIANGGGMNPRACALAIAQQLAELNIPLKVAVVEGDNLLSTLPELLSKGEEFAHFETKRKFSEIQDQLVSANVYIGCEAIAQALAAGASIVVTGRVADAALALAPMVHEFNWSLDDWDRLAAGTIAGHVLECGAQASGGNDSYDWTSIQDLATIGYPIVEMYEDGQFDVYKHESLGGRVSRETVTQQLIYEIGDPAAYYVPDVIADFTSLSLSDTGPNRVRISNCRGKAKPAKLKVSMSYDHGYMVTASILFSWPEAARKVDAAIEILKKRLELSKINPARSNFESIGVNACFGKRAPEPSSDLAEAQLRVAAWDLDKAVLDRLSREIAPLVLNGPPSATAYAAGKR
jgi:hypothetical protein